MKQLKKILMVTALFFAVGTMYAEKATDGMYFGVDMGLAKSEVTTTLGSVNSYMSGNGGKVHLFEMVPYFGITPSFLFEGASLEFAMQMDFYSDKTSWTDVYDEKWSDKTTLHFITPQVLFAYQFTKGNLTPYIKAGIGLNFNGGKYELTYKPVTEVTSFDIKASLAFVVNVGVEYEINEHNVVVFTGRFNANTAKASAKGILDDVRFCLDTKSLGFGYKYLF